MTNRDTDSEEETRRLVVAITDFLRDQLLVRTDLVPEDRDCLEIAIQSLEMAYGLEGDGYLHYRFSRPLLDIFNQVTNPISVKDKLRADAHKDEGNSYMRRNMFSNAETEYTNAIDLDKWNAIYFCNRASSRIEQRNFFEAISDCRQALSLNPDYAKAHARMGQAYALIHRPREAARCFRQALEIEPDNERYRNNLRVAESEISRPDPMELINALFGSLLGLRPGDESGSSGTVRMPTSFMIITESHPPTQPAPTTQSTETMLDSQGADEFQTSEDTRRASSIGSITFNLPFGVIDEGSEEQPILEFDVSRQACPTGENAEGVGERPFHLCPCDYRTDNVEQGTERKLDASHERAETEGQKDSQKNEEAPKSKSADGHESDIKREEKLTNQITSSPVKTDRSANSETDMNEQREVGTLTPRLNDIKGEENLNNQNASHTTQTGSSPLSKASNKEGGTEPKTPDKVVEKRDKMNENETSENKAVLGFFKNAEHEEKSKSEKESERKNHSSAVDPKSNKQETSESNNPNKNRDTGESSEKKTTEDLD